MNDSPLGTIAVVGATGLQGRAVVRRLLQEGWSVRALTRDPTGRVARALTAMGAEVVRADTGDATTLDAPFRAADGVFSVQNHHVSGYDGEVAQGRNVADAVLRTGVGHLVYSAAGVGQVHTGVGSWDTKLEVVRHLQERAVPVTVLRPMAFMELMTAGKFVPAASTWSMMPRLMGEDRPVGWFAIDDLAAVVATVFADREQFLGKDLPLVADVRSLRECRQLWRQVMGRSPRRLPLPVRLFERVVGTDETTMWRWLADNHIDLEPAATRAVHPDAMTVEAWLHRQREARGRGRRLATRRRPVPR